jgi:hypothetical protein
MRSMGVRAYEALACILSGLQSRVYMLRCSALVVGTLV